MLSKVKESKMWLKQCLDSGTIPRLNMQHLTSKLNEWQEILRKKVANLFFIYTKINFMQKDSRSSSRVSYWIPFFIILIWIAGITMESITKRDRKLTHEWNNILIFHFCKHWVRKCIVSCASQRAKCFQWENKWFAMKTDSSWSFNEILQTDHMKMNKTKAGLFVIIDRSKVCSDAVPEEYNAHVTIRQLLTKYPFGLSVRHRSSVLSQ